MKFKTDRLELTRLTEQEAGFMLELVNTPGWLRFIGDRKVSTHEEAKQYVKKIMDNHSIQYWVARRRTDQVPLGIVSFLKRTYLEHWDIGFAFLPQYAKQGYAFEAAAGLLNKIKNDPQHRTILATTKKDNIQSIRLLEKLGLRFDKAVKFQEEDLLVFAISPSP